MAIPLDKFAFVFEEGNIHLEIDPSLGDQAENWQFFLLDRAGHRIAGVVRRPSHDGLRIFETRPPLAPPVVRNNDSVAWFPAPI